MNKPNISSGKWKLRKKNENPWKIGVVENHGILIAETKTGHDAKAISQIPNIIDDYMNLIYAIENCKTDAGAVILGDNLEKSIKKTANKMGFKL